MSKARASTDPLAAAAQRIKRLRAKHGLSQAAFGAEIGVTGAKVGHWEQGDRALPVRAAVAIKRRFRVTLDWIYGA